MYFLSLFLVALLALFILSNLKKVELKGFIGEKTVAIYLSLLDKTKYKILNDVVLSTGETTNTQIDHIVVSNYGIFVIETKFYKGIILGNEKSEYWTQVLYKRKHKLYNPLRQNAGHIISIQKHLSIDKNHLPIVSIIVFPAKTKIKVNSSFDIINTFQLNRTIKKYTNQVLSESQKEDIFQKLQGLNMIELFDKKQHIKNIEQKIQQKENSIFNNICPRCGNSLRPKKGKFGEFLSCNSYPRCKFTRNL